MEILKVWVFITDNIESIVLIPSNVYYYIILKQYDNHRYSYSNSDYFNNYSLFWREWKDYIHLT